VSRATARSALTDGSVFDFKPEEGVGEGGGIGSNAGAREQLHVGSSFWGTRVGDLRDGGRGELLGLMVGSSTV
jgi:hypothetical protein